MRNLPKLAILLAMQAGLMLSAAPLADAATAGAAQALQILTRARVSDERCHFLSAAQHDELARYTARAEVAASQQLSTGIASTAVRNGTAEGQAVACTDAAKADVAETLAAARQAVNAADGRRGSSPPPRQVTRAAPETQPPGPRGRVGSLAYYGSQIRPYYLERRCRMLSPAQDARYWRAITRLHQATVARNGYAAVSALMHRAEVSASTRSCGGEALATIRAGYAAAVND